MGIKLIISTLLFLSACGPLDAPPDATSFPPFMPSTMTAEVPVYEEDPVVLPGPPRYEAPSVPWVEPGEPWDDLVPRPEPEEPPCARCDDVLD